jgi:SAM-dependent methyltransferase
MSSFRESAGFYDEMVGYTAFEHIRENFDRICSIYSLTFASCADVACGTGIFVQYLTGLAERVYGVEPAPEMLAQARRRNAGNQAVFLPQSFAELELPEQVDLVTCNFDSLNYLLTEAEVGEALARFCTCLKPGGHAIFDMNTIWQLEELSSQEPWVHTLPDGYSIWETAWDAERQIQSLHMVNLLREPSGLYRRSEELHQERGYPLTLLEELIAAAGFAWHRAYDAETSLGYPGPTTRRLVFIAGVGES